MSKKIIGFPHPPQVFGGPGSFQTRLETALKGEGWKIVYPQNDILPEVILIVGGTRKHKWLKNCKKQGARIVHRLDGRNWLHRISKVPLKEKILSEVRNRMTAKIRNKFADHIIYQSQFVKDWWERVSGIPNKPASIIHNAVNLKEFVPNKGNKPKDIICVEGNIDYTPHALETLQFLVEKYKGKKFDRILVYGSFNNEKVQYDYPNIDFMGKIEREKISEVYKNGIFLSMDVNAACPNTVIESLAKGIPVVGFDTGSLKELVMEGAGEIVDYGGNSWKLEAPAVENLCKGFDKVFDDYGTYSVNARNLAEREYSIESLVKKYLKVLTSDS